MLSSLVIALLFGVKIIIFVPITYSSCHRPYASAAVELTMKRCLYTIEAVRSRSRFWVLTGNNNKYFE